MRSIEFKKFKWIDIEGPSEEDIEWLEKEYGLHPIILEEIRTPTLHPLFESYEKYIFSVMHFPHFNRAHDRIETIEIDFIITKNSILTVHYKGYSDLDEVFREIESEQEREEATSGEALHHIVKSLFKKTAPELAYIKQAVDEAEDAMLDYINERNIEQLAETKRLVLDFLRVLRPQKSLWAEDIPEAGLSFWGESMKPYISDLAARYNKILYFAENYLSIIDSIYATSSVLLDNRRGNVIKVLTIFTAIVLPLTLITSVYGMNIVGLPGAQHPHVFWWFVGGLTTLTAGMIVYFRYSKWI